MTEHDLDENPDEAEPTTVSDPESYVNKRRLKGIFDIRDEMREARTRVKIAPQQDNITKFQALSVYRALVNSYIIEAEPLLKKYKGGKRLLEKKDFGTESLCPTFEKNSNSSRYSSYSWRVFLSDDPTIDREKIRVRRKPQPTTFNLKGLLSVSRLPDPLEAEYKLDGQVAHSTSKTINYRCVSQISYEKLDNMVRSLNNFLGEAGFEVDPEQKDPEDGFLDL
jgi:hypothetical protein